MLLVAAIAAVFVAEFNASGFSLMYCVNAVLKSPVREKSFYSESLQKTGYFFLSKEGCVTRDWLNCAKSNVSC